jgi:hypothetical protein
MGSECENCEHRSNGEHLAKRLDNLEQDQRRTQDAINDGLKRVWDAFTEHGKTLQEIAVNTAGLPRILKDQDAQAERLMALETSETLRKGAARQNRKISARILAVASLGSALLGSAVGPIVDWLKKFMEETR